MFLVVLDISPQGFLEDLHSYIFIIMFMLMFVCCCDRNKVQFNIQLVIKLWWYSRMTLMYLHCCYTTDTAE